MWVLHLINRMNPETSRPHGIFKVKDEQNTYYSCCWDIDPEESMKLIGGMIFLHETKSHKSNLGGRVTDVIPVNMEDNSKYDFIEITEGTDPKRLERVMFKFEITPDGREQSHGSRHPPGAE